MITHFRERTSRQLTRWRRAIVYWPGTATSLWLLLFLFVGVASTPSTTLVNLVSQVQGILGIAHGGTGLSSSGSSGNFLKSNGSAWTSSALDSDTISKALKCAAASASGTAYTCTTSPSFTPAAQDALLFKADVANTASATLNVNSTSAATIKKQGGGTNLVANDLLASQWTLLVFDGTNWQMQGQTGNAASGGASLATYYAGSASSGSLGSAPTSATLVPALTITTTASGTAKVFSVSGMVVWQTGTHGMRGSVYVDGTLSYPHAVEINPIATGDGGYVLTWSGIVVTIPGDNATHTVELRWSAQSSTGGFTYYDRWITMIQVG